jgi:hypothetical protein
MRTPNPLAGLAGETDCRFCLVGGIVLLVAIVAVGYGIRHQDVVTALGALLLVPAGVLLAAIGLSGGGGDSDSGRPL